MRPSASLPLLALVCLALLPAHGARPPNPPHTHRGRPVTRPLTCRGPNFGAATRFTCALGRHHLHPTIATVVEDAYTHLARSHPQRWWQFGETGLAGGGPMWPHRTHQNGTSVDFFVPVSGPDGHPTTLPTHPFNLFGYGIDVSPAGTTGPDHVDFRALADHLLALRAAASGHGVTLHRVILDTRPQPALLAAAPDLGALRPSFNRRQAWVRHDEHYHVDFRLPAAPQKP